MKLRRAVYGVFTAALVAISVVGSAQTPITGENAGQLAQVATLQGHTGPVFSLAFSPDGATLLSGGSGSDYTARLWDVASASEKAVLEEHSGQIAAVAFNADGTTAFTASYDATIKVWNTETGELIETQDKSPDTGDMLTISNLNTFFNGDGSKLVYADDMLAGVYVWDLKMKMQTDIAANIPELSGTIGSIGFSKDGTTVAVQQMEGPVYVLNAESGEQINLLTLPENFLYLTALALNPDATMLAAAEYDSATIQLVDVETGEAGALLEGHAANTQGTLGIYGLAFNPDGTLLASASYDNTLRLWDVATGEELVSVETGGTGTSSVAWSPDGSMLATGDLSGTITLWSVGE
jgi:WD40 repeat protein